MITFIIFIPVAIQIVGEVGVDACPAGYKSIKDEVTCETASKYLGLEYRGDRNKDSGICNWCGGCNTANGGQSVRITGNHGGKAKWICELAGNQIL